MEDNVWKGRPVAHSSHKKSLELSSAVNEFGRKLPRKEAEEKAYHDYKQDQHAEAAKHHHDGIKAAQAVGDHDTAKKHWAMYAIHSKALGHDPVGEPHESVKAKKSEPHKFTVHKADCFAV